MGMAHGGKVGVGRAPTLDRWPRPIRAQHSAGRPSRAPGKLGAAGLSVQPRVIDACGGKKLGGMAPYVVPFPIAKPPCTWAMAARES